MADKIIERQCAVSRKTMQTKELIRFVLDPDGNVFPDVRGKLPGRGVWIEGKASVLRQAIETPCFARQFKTKAQTSQDLVAQTKQMLEQAAMGQLKMTNKAGRLIFGATKLSAALEKKTFVAMVHADEASLDGCEKLDRKFCAIRDARRSSEDDDTQEDDEKFIFRFPQDHLAQVFGTSDVMHIGLLKGPISKRFIAASRRLQRFLAE